MASTEQHDEQELAARYAAAVGSRLRAVRRQKRLSLQAVEASSAHEFKASVLGAYERGERSISVPRLQRLARLYDVPVDQLLPREEAEGSTPSRGGAPASTDRARNGTGRMPSKITVDLTKLNETKGPERDLLRHFLASIQVQRQDFNGRMITIRSDDLRIMASMFGRTGEGMAGRLDELGLLHRI